jgi:hypothetical protein
MRVLIGLVLCAGLVACEPPRIDNTMNRPAVGQAVNYPAGPYGYTEGQVMRNIKLVGKRVANHQAPHLSSAEPISEFSLADYFNDPEAKLLVISGVAGWCVYCNQEQAEVPELLAKYEPQGVRFVQGLVEGWKPGTPATPADLDRWIDKHDLKTAVALDPDGEFQRYADVGSFPLFLIVTKADMRIQTLQIGLPQSRSVEPLITDYL